MEKKVEKLQPKEPKLSLKIKEKVLKEGYREVFIPEENKRIDLTNPTEDDIKLLKKYKHFAV